VRHEEQPGGDPDERPGIGGEHGINSAQRRSQEKISRRCSDHASPPIDDRFKWPRSQAGCARRKSESQLHYLGRAERKTLWLSTKDVARARFTTGCLERHPDVRADGFQSRGIAYPVRRGFYRSVFGLKGLNQTTRTRLPFDHLDLEAFLGEIIGSRQSRETCADNFDLHILPSRLVGA